MPKARSWLWAMLVAVEVSSGCGSGKGSPGRAAADRVEQALADALASDPQGSTARLTITVTETKKSVNGKLVGGSITWTCTGETAGEANSCQEGAKGDNHCKNTSNGATCTWTY